MLKFEICYLKNTSYRDFKPNIIYIAPEINTDWNDFTYKCRCQLYFKTDDGVSCSSSLLFCFLSDENDSKGIGYINVINENKNTSEYKYKFSLLSSIREYSELINTLGVEIGNKVLESIDDIVYLKRYNKQILKPLQNSSVFKLSFMRNSEPFFAYHKADKILDGSEYEENNYLSKEYKLKFKLEAFNNEHEFTFKFDDEKIIPKRINLIIGKNGLGKSQTLNTFVKAALQKRDYKENLSDNNYLEKAMINKIIAIGTPGETVNTFPSDKIRNKKISYQRLNLTRHKKTAADETIGEALLKLARIEDSVVGNSRWYIFIQAISQCLSYKDLHLFNNPDKNQLQESIPLDSIKHRNSEEKQLNLWSTLHEYNDPKIKINNNFYNLSSGQLSFFKFCLLSSLHIENGSLVLLDEPETHLHPNLISDFMRILNELLRLTGSYCIIATHSSYFVRHVTREQVHVLKKDTDNNIHIINPRLKTYGTDIGAISDFIFDEAFEDGLISDLYMNAKQENRSFDDLTRLYRDELPIETFIKLKRLFNK